MCLFDYPFVLPFFIFNKKDLLHTLICFHSLPGEDSDTNNDSEKLSESVDEFSDIRVIENEIQQNLDEISKNVEVFVDDEVEELEDEIQEEPPTDQIPEKELEIVTDFEELVSSNEPEVTSSENQTIENEVETISNEQKINNYEQKTIETATTSVGTDDEPVFNYHDHYNIPMKISPPRNVETIKTKVSTGCGPSPPRTIQSPKPVKKMSTSTGTSPPPQNISTQVIHRNSKK